MGSYRYSYHDDFRIETRSEPQPQYLLVTCINLNMIPIRKFRQFCKNND